MNTAILSPSGGSIGIGFAIPANTIKSIVAQIIKNGHVTRGFLGVEAQAVDQPMAEALHLPGNGDGALNGALIAQVEPNSPAEKAGLKPGDVIEKVNSDTIHTPRDLAVTIAGISPGEQATLDIIRNGQQQDVPVQIAQLKTQVASNNQQNQPDASQGGVGLALAPLTPDLRSQLGVPDGTDGAVVAQVTPNSPADQAGIEQGDVVLGVNSTSVGSPNRRRPLSTRRCMPMPVRLPCASCARASRSSWRSRRTRPPANPPHAGRPIRTRPRLCLDRVLFCIEPCGGS